MKTWIRNGIGALGITVSLPASLLSCFATRNAVIMGVPSGWCGTPLLAAEFLLTRTIPVVLLIASSGAAMIWYARWDYGVVIARCSVLIAVGFWLFGLLLNNFGDLFPG